MLIPLSFQPKGIKEYKKRHELREKEQLKKKAKPVMQYVLTCAEQEATNSRYAAPAGAEPRRTSGPEKANTEVKELNKCSMNSFGLPGSGDFGHTPAAVFDI